MSPLEWLGLGADADERMVKRAYALRLRTTRPEDDPEGFQQLHAIYQAALALCRHAPVVATAQAAKAATPRTPMIPAMPAAATEPAPPPFDPVGFLAGAIRHAAAGDAAALLSWLNGQPALWSLRTKAQAGQRLLDQLYRQQPPMPPACLDVLLRFFDMDHAMSGHDPLALQRLQRRLQLAWELQPEHHDALARRLGIEAPTLARWLRQLSRPLRAWQVALVGLIPEAAGDLARFAARLTDGHPEDLPPPYDPRQASFWLEAVMRGRVGKPRLLLGGSRCVAALLGATLFGLLLGLSLAIPPESFSFTVLAWVVGMVAVPCLFWTLAMAWLPLEDWHARPEQLSVRWPWLNLLLVPLLCAIGLAGWSGMDRDALVILPMIVALWLAFRRLLLRSHGTARITPRVIWVASFIAYPLLNAAHADELADSIGILVVAAMLLWGLDLWRHRRCLRVMQRTR